MAKKQTKPETFKSYKDKINNRYVIEILDCIGWWNDVSWLSWELRMAGGEDIHFKLHSEGGVYLDGIAMMNLLKGYVGNVVIECIGFAASAATMVMAGGRSGMRKGSFYMIHEPETMSGGRADKLEKDAKLLRKMRSEAADIYVEVIESNGRKIKKSKVLKWMEDETWFSAEEALEVGLISFIADGEAFKPVEDSSGNVMDYLDKFENTPDLILNLFNKNRKTKMSQKKKSKKKKSEGAFMKFMKGAFKMFQEENAVDVGLSEEDKQLKKLLEDKGYSEEDINDLLAVDNGVDDAVLSEDEEKTLNDLLKKKGIELPEQEVEVEETAEVVEMRKKLEDEKKKRGKLAKMIRKKKVINASTVTDKGGQDVGATESEKRIKKVLNNRKRLKGFDKLSTAILKSSKKG